MVLLDTRTPVPDTAEISFDFWQYREGWSYAIGTAEPLIYKHVPLSGSGHLLVPAADQLVFEDDGTVSVWDGVRLVPCSFMSDAHAAELTDYIERVRQRTLRVAAVIPPEQIEWTYREGKFTLGDLLRHLGSIERWMFAENARRRPSRYPGHGRELAEGREAILDFMGRMHEESMAIFRSLSDEDLDAKTTTPGGAELRIGKWLRSMIEHEIHHRGQIYLYLSMLGVETPPLYGLTEEEVKRRSGA